MGQSEWDLPSSNTSAGSESKNSIQGSFIAATIPHGPRAAGLRLAGSIPGAMLCRAACHLKACQAHSCLSAKHGSSSETEAVGACLNKHFSVYWQQQSKFADVTSPGVIGQSRTTVFKI